MLINDFIKFTSATFPNESFVKTPTNRMFNTKIRMKNIKDTLTRNNGIRMEEKEEMILSITPICRTQ